MRKLVLLLGLIAGLAPTAFQANADARERPTRRADAPTDHETRSRTAAYVVSVGVHHDGGGVAVSDHLILTSAALLASCGTCEVRVGGGDPWRWHDARRVTVDADSGFGLLRVEAGGLAPADLQPHRTGRGEGLYAFPPSNDTPGLRRVAGATHAPRATARRAERDADADEFRGLILSNVPISDGSIGAAVFSARNGRFVGIIHGAIDEPGHPAHGLTAALGAASAIRFIQAATAPPADTE